MTQAQTRIGGRYRLLEHLAAGGMGTVWLAHDDLLDRPVVVKQLHMHTGLPAHETELAAQRAMREARITAKLHHPHAVDVYDVVDHDGRPCLVIQYLPSTSLDRILAEKGPLPPGQAARWGEQVGSALATAHEAGIVHRDVKPGNVLITESGDAVITDFGIAHALGDPSLTSTGIVTGTPAYLAPEAARGVDSGRAADVFSLGATLYAAVEGEPPFGTDANPMAMLHRVASGQIRQPRRSGALTPVLQRMLALDPAARPPMRDAVRDLAGVAAAADGPLANATTQHVAPVRRTPPPAPPPTMRTAPLGRPPAPPLAPPDRRRTRALWPWFAIAALLLIALVAGLVWAAGGSNGPSTPRAGTGSTRAGTTSHHASASSSSSPATSRTTSATASTTGNGSGNGSGNGHGQGGTAAQLAAAITDYYALLPADTDTAWSRLTPRYQQGTAGGRDSFDAFWGGIRSVSTSDVQGRAPDSVTATITYVRSDGSTSVERTAFTLVEDGGVWKIDASSVLGG